MKNAYFNYFKKMSKNIKCVMTVPFKIIRMASVGKSYKLHVKPSQFSQSCVQQVLSQGSLYLAGLQLLGLQGQMSATSLPQLPTRLPCCYSRDIGPPGQQLSLQKDFTEHEFPEGGSLHKDKDGLCSIIRCRFWVCRVEYLKLKEGPRPLCHL